MKLSRLAFVFMLTLCSASALAATGTVKFDIDSLVMQDHQLVPVPYVDANVFLDGNHPYGSGEIAARTDENGEAVLELEEGEHTVIFSKWTSSHSVFASPVYTFTIEAGKQTDFYEALVTTRATIIANADAGWGNALYITGETELLGNWQTAYRMNAVSGNEWSYFDRLPRDIEYKIVRGPWVEGVDEISTNDAQWEYGSNHSVEFVEFLNNYVTPQF